MVIFTGSGEGSYRKCHLSFKLAKTCRPFNNGKLMGEEVISASPMSSCYD